MSSAAKNWWQKVRAQTATDADGWEKCSGLNKAEAEQLLDWLEANGWPLRELILGEDGFTVRWRRAPPAEQSGAGAAE